MAANWPLIGHNFPKKSILLQKGFDSFAGYQTMRLNPLESEKLSLGKSDVRLSSYRRFKVFLAKKSFSLKF